MDIFEEVVRIRKEGRSAALATLVQSMGSSPQKEGAKILVLEDGTLIGTLGGGCLEANVADAALKAMSSGKPCTIPFSLTEKHGDLACGGRVLVYIEPLLPVPHLIILGAGHVGQALCRIGKFIDFRITVVDDREEYANRHNLPEADEIVVSEFDRVFASSKVPRDENTWVVVATRGHLHDLEALQAALDTRAGYIGLLGSRRKKTMLFSKLKEAGFSTEAIEKIHTPVGLSIGAATPEEIAISIAAQLIELRRKASADQRHRACGGSFTPHAKAQAASAPSR